MGGCRKMGGEGGARMVLLVGGDKCYCCCYNCMMCSCCLCPLNLLLSLSFRSAISVDVHVAFLCELFVRTFVVIGYQFVC